MPHLPLIKKWLFLPQIVALLLGLALGARGENQSHVTAQLLAEPAAITPGMPFLTAVNLKMDPGWHTYSKDPGDSGLPTKIDWLLPKGFTAGDIQWPVPLRIENPPLVDFGYKKEVSLLVLITPPSRMNEKSVTLSAHVRWLGCKDVCVPGQADVAVSLPVSPVPVPPSTERRAFFDAARQKITPSPPPSFSFQKGFLAAFLLAFLGGLLLNLMPCVLPVLSMKVLGFLETPRHVLRRYALLYLGGVWVSFWSLSGLLILLRTSGEKLGWGFQLQSPIFVGVMILLFVLLGLNLLGFFEIGTSLVGLGRFLGGRSAASAFLSGALAVLVATPCTAPFMGPALGFALTQPALISLGIFTALGGGLATPYVLLSFFPMGLRWLPKPGPWMLTLKRVMALLFFATALWLLWVLALQKGAVKRGGNKEPFSEQRVQALVADGRTIFVDFTAAWCITCQVNERTTLSSETVQKLFAAKNVAFLVADWTERDPHVTQALEQFGRSGVPLYVVYRPGRDPLLLPTLLTPEIVRESLK